MSGPVRHDEPARGGVGASDYATDRADLERLRLPRDAEGDIAARRRRRWPWLLAALLVLSVSAAALWRLADRPLAVETVRAVPLAEVAGEPVPVLSGSGYLVPAQPFIAVGSRVAGRIERYLVEEGDRVRAGQPMVELDPTPFRAVVEQVRASLVSARAQRTLAEAELERARNLIDQGVLSQDEYDRRESEARVARARVAELEASLDRADTDLDDAVIRAPTDGVVLETYKQPGEIAVPGGFSGSGDLLRLANLSELRAELDVNEADLPRVTRGQEAEIVPDAFPDARYAGRVVKLAPQIDRQKGTREVEVVVLEPDDRLLPDMSVRVVFFERFPGPAAAAGSAGRSTAPANAPPPNGAADAPVAAGPGGGPGPDGDAGAGTGGGTGPRGAVIPRGALRRDEAGRTFVWLARDGRAAVVPVEIGETLGDRLVVRDGLAGGESVILGDPPRREGAAVVEQDAAAGAALP